MSVTAVTASFLYICLFCSHFQCNCTLEMNDKTSSTNAYIVSLVCVFHAVFSIKCAYFACSARDVRCLQCMYRYLLYIEVRCYFFPLHSRMWQICDILKDELLLRYSTRQILRLSSKPLLIFVEAVFDSLEIPRSYLFWWCLPFLLCTLLDWVGSSHCKHSFIFNSCMLFGAF